MVRISVLEARDQIVNEFVEAIICEVLRRNINLQIWVARRGSGGIARRDAFLLSGQKGVVRVLL